MMTTATAELIGLSGWYACFNHRTRRMEVFQAERGCQVAVFGSDSLQNSAVFSGFLFDRHTLTRDLGVSPHTREVDLVVAAYERWGRSAFDRLDGCFLAAIWDATADRLFLGRDALGHHPAFYASTPDAVWFSGNLLTLVATGAVPARVNRVSLGLLLMGYWPEAGETYYELIRRARPGHLLDVASDGAVRETKYWEPWPADDEPWIPDHVVLESFEQELIAAVDRCMQLQPEGVMLSGGLDSVTVAAVAAGSAQNRGVLALRALCGRIDKTPGSYEEAAQAPVAEALGMPLHVSTVDEWLDGTDDVQLSLDALNWLPGPTHIWWTGRYVNFYRWSAQHARVLLTGSGGDNWLGVADEYAADLLRRLHFRELSRLLTADVTTAGGSLRRSTVRLLWTRGLRPHVDAALALAVPRWKAQYHRRRWEQRLPAWIAPEADLRAKLLDRLANRRAPSLSDRGTIPASYYRHVMRSQGNPYRHYEHEVAHHVTAHCGLRLLSPYHDRRLVSFFCRISPSALLHDGRYKGLLRPIAEKRLPGLGFKRQNKSYDRDITGRTIARLRKAVAAEWPRHQFDALLDLGVVDPTTLRSSENLSAGSLAETGQMFSVMAADTWVRRATRPAQARTTSIRPNTG